MIGNKTGASRLGFTVLLNYFQQEARFLSKEQDIPKNEGMDSLLFLKKKPQI